MLLCHAGRASQFKEWGSISIVDAYHLLYNFPMSTGHFPYEGEATFEKVLNAGSSITVALTQQSMEDLETRLRQKYVHVELGALGGGRFRRDFGEGMRDYAWGGYAIVSPDKSYFLHFKVAQEVVVKGEVDTLKKWCRCAVCESWTKLGCRHCHGCLKCEEAEDHPGFNRRVRDARRERDDFNRKSKGRGDSCVIS